MGRRTLELGVENAVITFNDGNIARSAALQWLELKRIGYNTVLSLKHLDGEKIHKADLVTNNETKECKQKQRSKIMKTGW